MLHKLHLPIMHSIQNQMKIRSNYQLGNKQTTIRYNLHGHILLVCRLQFVCTGALSRAHAPTIPSQLNHFSKYSIRAIPATDLLNFSVY